MIILIKTRPYQNENVLGALFIALSTADAEKPTSVIFLENGLYSLFKDQMQDESLSLPSISDLILQLVGTVNFYFVPSSNPNFPINFEDSHLMEEIVYGIKKIQYQDVVNFIQNEGKNLIIL